MENNIYIDTKIISNIDNDEFEDKMFDCVNDGWKIRYIDFKITEKNPNGIWIAFMFKNCIEED